MKLVPIPQVLVDEVWEEARPFIARACDHNLGRMDTDDVRALLDAGSMQLVAVYDGGTIVGALTTEVVTYPRARALRVVHLGGERFAEWKDEAIQLLDIGARNCGATLVEFYGRPGWERIFRGIGTKIAVVIEREVQP